MAKTIAKVYGTALAPGVSRNGRLYTREVIRKAVERAQARLAQGGLNVRERVSTAMDAHPMAQRTHHAAEDDSTRIVGRVHRLWLGDNGEALFEAHIANTESGRTIAELVDTAGGPPFLRGVSIRGAWMGESYKTHHEGQLVDTADDLEIDGLDYTHKPGVPGAVIDRVERVGGGPRETTPDGRAVIYESIQEARVSDAVEETSPAPSAPATAPQPEVVYADPGWGGEKRWPLSTVDEAVTAWGALHDVAEMADYSTRQRKRMRGRVVRKLQESGLSATSEGYLIGEALSERARGSLDVSLSNGDGIRVTVTAYGVEQADLELMGRRAMDGAVRAHQLLDPDAAGDAWLPTEGGHRPDDQMESGGFVPFKKGQNSPADQAKGGGKPKPGKDDDDSEDDDETEESGGFVPFKKGQNSVSDQKKGAGKKGADDDEDDKAEKGDKGKKPWESGEAPSAVTESGAATQNQENPAVAENVTLTADQFAQLLAAAKGAPAAAEVEAPVESAPAGAPVEETVDEKVARLVAEKLAAAGVAAPVEETAEQKQARLIEEGVQKAIGAYVAQNGAPRKGLVAESGHRGVHGGTITQAAGVAGASTVQGFDKPLHQLSDDEWGATAGVAIERHVMGSRSVYAQS